MNSFRVLLTGAVLVIAANAANAQATTGDLVAGISYSNRYGLTGDLGLEINDLFNGSTDLQLGYREGDTGSELSGAIMFSKALESLPFGPGSQLLFSMSGNASSWNVDPYSIGHVEAFAGIGAMLGGNARWKAGLFHRWDSLATETEGGSPWITSYEGVSAATGAEAEVVWSTYLSADPTVTGQEFRFGVASTLNADAGRNWTSLNASGDITVAAFGTTVLHLGAGAGQISDNSGTDGVHLLDRYFPDGLSPRGFEWGSAGPYDSDTGEALGGTRYVAGTIELIAPLPRPGLSASAFFDAGAVWDLGPLAGGTVVDDYGLRTSAGLSLNWTTALGRLQVSYAEPIQFEPSDKIDQFSIRFRADF